ncbi:MAG: hypothetical protein IGS03_08975 [Candidatus Sericytochromatia bacterium]|nr:hypothetical protein [Candidatus Sericytochromatia bacterium]
MFKNRYRILSALLTAALTLSPGFSSWAQPSPGAVQAQNIPDAALSDWILEPMPDWYQEGFSRGHLHIPKMLQAGFSRLQAVEIQNQMKDILAQDPAFQQAEQQGQSADWFRKPDLRVLKALQTAIERVMRAGQHEHGFVPQTLKPGDFYVVFDMDETLLQQSQCIHLSCR